MRFTLSLAVSVSSVLASSCALCLAAAFAPSCLSYQSRDFAGGSPAPGTGSSSSSSSSGAPATSAPPLRAAAESANRLIGVAYNTTHAADGNYVATAAAHFDYVTPENEMKWNATEPSQGVFTFAGGDAVVAFAQQNGMKVKGHNFVWDKQLPGWVTALTGQDAVQAAMVNHITQLASHFKGQVVAWDVVNEAWNDDGQSLKSDVFEQYLGDGYIDLAFQTARAADPDALLYYNDFGIEGSTAKANAVYAMVQGMKARGVPIDGVGMQMHTQWGDNNPNVTDFASNMARFAALGVTVVISEFDVELCAGSEIAQQARFHDIIAACLQQPACTAVTVWGVTDRFSWLNGAHCTSPTPLLFDSDYDVKPAFTGALDAFNGM